MTTIHTVPSTSTQLALLTAAEFAVRYEHVHAELVKGVVQEYPVAYPHHGKICMTIGALLWQHVQENDLGHVMTNDSWIQTGRNPDTIRGADVCYFSYERLPKGEVPRGLLPVVPDLVVEVRSPRSASISRPGFVPC
jgi:Uma2 family endonuclease